MGSLTILYDLIVDIFAINEMLIYKTPFGKMEFFEFNLHKGEMLLTLSH